MIAIAAPQRVGFGGDHERKEARAAGRSSDDRRGGFCGRGAAPWGDGRSRTGWTFRTVAGSRSAAGGGTGSWWAVRRWCYRRIRLLPALQLQTVLRLSVPRGLLPVLSVLSVLLLPGL